jgi:hypothetical protein
MSESVSLDIKAGDAKRNRKADFGGKVKAHQRYYASDGEMLAGATTVIGVLGLGKDRLIRWANRKGLEGIDSDKYKDEAAESGTCLHYLVECYMRGVEPELSDYSANQIERANIGLAAFKKWREENYPRLKMIEAEVRLVSDTYRYGGTLDLYCEFDGPGTEGLVDYKTSTGIYLEHKVQVTSYVKLARENGRPIHRAILLQLPQVEDGEAIPHTLNGRHMKLYWRMFELCLAVRALDKEIRKEGA